MSDYNFKGHDYTELFPHLGIDSDNDDYDGDIIAFKGKLSSLLGRAYNSDDLSEEVFAIKMYLKAMAETGIDYWGPVWDGLIEVEDDSTFLQACFALADHMWT